MKHSAMQKLVYSMLTENTGIHMCDSGGDNGRAWQRNQKRTIDEFIKDSEAYIELSRYENTIDVVPTISVFHYLTRALSLDAKCRAFNRMEVLDHGNDLFYGVSTKGGEWLESRFDTVGDNFYSYNWSSALSQDVQGCMLKCKDTGDSYVILQIHNGADARGGLTDAKLFKCDTDCFLDESVMSEHFDIMYGELTSHEGHSLQDDELLAIGESLGLLQSGDSIAIEGTMYIGDC